MGQPATVNVGHQATCTYVLLDQNNNPMLNPVALDKPAAWTDSPSGTGVDSNVVSADGTVDVVNALAAGSDTIGVSVTVGGKTFTDSVLLTISPAPQVASGVLIQTAVE
jgi:hypothetical protein